MANDQIFKLSRSQRDQLLQELSTLLRERVVLQQMLRDQQENVAIANEELFLELLEVFDGLEFLLNYVAEHPDPNHQSWANLLKSLTSFERKFINLLAKREVNSIELQGTKPDFSLCQVVDQVVCNDLEASTITKVVRKGFRLGNKVLRPVEVITSKTE